MSFEKFRDWILTGLLAGCAGLAVDSLRGVEKDIKTITKSIEELNLKLGEVIAIQTAEQRKTEDHETRLRYLERRLRH